MLDQDLDKRTKRGRELADRMNKQTILDNMPKLYFVEDKFHDGYRLGRTDWPGDSFHIIPRDKFETFREIYEAMSMPLLDKTHDED